MAFSNDGTKMFVGSQAIHGNDINEYALSYTALMPPPGLCFDAF